jgi:hypothetical protein
MWSNTEWRAGLLRTADGGKDKVAGGNWHVVCYARHGRRVGEELWHMGLGVMRRAG